MTKTEIKSYEFHPLPTTLDEARIAIRNLPGAEYYIPSTAIASPEIDNGADQMLEEMLKQLDAENMLPEITYNLGWSDAQAQTFFAHPERRPFQSRLELSVDLGKRAQQFLTIGTYLRLRYENARARVESSSEQMHEQAVIILRTAADTLRNFLEFSTYNLFAQESFDLSDWSNGIDPRDRRAGTIKPSPTTLQLIKDAAKTVTKQEGTNWTDVYEEVLKAIEGGNLTTAFTFLMNRKGDPAVRKTLQEVLEKIRYDKERQIRKIQLVWNVEAFRMLMGIDWETYLTISDLPNSQTVEKRLLAFLLKPDLVAETLSHLQQEAPKSYEVIKHGGVADYWTILEERAIYHKFSDKIELPEELLAKKQKVWHKIAGLLPLAFEDTPRSFVDAPTCMGANPRACNITYYNSAGELINVVILDPREQKDKFEEVAGHEYGHKLHAKVLNEAENAGYLPKGSNEHVPGSVKEEFSQLIEDQVGRINKANKATGANIETQEVPPVSRGQFRDLAHAIVIRRQAPYALVQQAIRLEIENMWWQGKQAWDLSEEDAQALTAKFQSKTGEWYQTGVPIHFSVQTVPSNLNALSPDDGLVYMKKYLVERRPAPSQTAAARPEKEPEQKDMKTAFEERFGPTWLLNPNARKVLIALLAETGRNYDITTYASFVLNANIEKISAQLQEWGIDPNKV